MEGLLGLPRPIVTLVVIKNHASILCLLYRLTKLKCEKIDECKPQVKNVTIAIFSELGCLTGVIRIWDDFGKPPIETCGVTPENHTRQLISTGNTIKLS